MIRHFFEMASGHSITITTADIKANYIKISPVTRWKKKIEKQDQILNPEWDPGSGRKLV